MGRLWDGSGIAFDVDVWRECLRVIKPGGHLVAFGGTRTVHRLACAIEDAGWDIRDCGVWQYWSGFPKSHDISKAIDRETGAEREKVCRHPQPGSTRGRLAMGDGWQDEPWITSPATPEAAQWTGWGSALKPAWEPWVLARAPLSEPTLASNVLRWGTGGLHLDACRFRPGDSMWVGPDDGDLPTNHGGRAGGIGSGTGSEIYGHRAGLAPHMSAGQHLGRFPANTIHAPKAGRRERELGCAEAGLPLVRGFDAVGREEGSAGLTPADGAGRVTTELRNNHPTVKPLRIISWLVRLVTPPGGVVIDPFCGSGTTGMAAVGQGFGFQGIELDRHHLEIARARIAYAAAGRTIEAPDLEPIQPQPGSQVSLWGA